MKDIDPNEILSLLASSALATSAVAATQHERKSSERDVDDSITKFADDSSQKNLGNLDIHGERKTLGKGGVPEKGYGYDADSITIDGSKNSAGDKPLLYLKDGASFSDHGALTINGDGNLKLDSNTPTTGRVDSSLYSDLNVSGPVVVGAQRVLILSLILVAQAS